MKKLKKIFTCLVLMLVVIFASGCANVDYQRIVNNDGTIIDAVCVKLDEEKITTAGYNIATVTNEIKNKMTIYLQAMLMDFYDRDDGLLTIEKITVTNNLTAGVTNENGYIIASIKFKNYDAFRYYYGLHLIQEENDNANIVEEFLFNKNISTGKTIFSGADAKYFTNEFLAYFNNNFTIEDATLSYVFGTPENKLHSDATKQYSSGGINYHQWIVTDVNQEINTFTYQIKPINWYILALGLTLLFMLILFIISLFKKKTKKVQEETTNLIDLNNENLN